MSDHDEPSKDAEVGDGAPVGITAKALEELKDRLVAKILNRMTPGDPGEERVRGQRVEVSRSMTGQE